MHETFLRSWCLTWSEVLNLLVEVHVCPCFLENCSFVHSWNKKWGSILSHKLPRGGVKFYYLSKGGVVFLKTHLLDSWLSYMYEQAQVGYVLLQLCSSCDNYKEVSEEYRKNPWAFCIQLLSLFDVARMGPWKISVAVGLVLPIGWQ